MSNLSQQQFMTASALKGVVHGYLGKNADSVLKQKLAESKNETDEGWGHGLYNDIKRSGKVYEPVEIVHQKGETPYVEEGHHRIAVAHDLDPQMLVPVVHHYR